MAKEKKVTKKKVKKAKGADKSKVANQLTRHLKKVVKAHGPEVALALTASIVEAIIKRKELKTEKDSIAQSVKATIASISKKAKEAKDTVVEGVQDFVSSDDEKDHAPKRGRAKKGAEESVGGPSDESEAVAAG